MKPLSLYQGQLEALNHHRREIDVDIAQVLTEAVLDGHNLHDLLRQHDYAGQERFDL